MSCQGVRRTRKLCRAQQSSITISRTPSFHRRIRSLTMRQRLTLLLTCSIRSRRWFNAWFAHCCSHGSSWPPWLLGRHEDLHLRERERQKAQILQEPAPRGQGIGGCVGNGLIVDTAAESVAEEEDDEQGIDQQDIFYC